MGFSGEVKRCGGSGDRIGKTGGLTSQLFDSVASPVYGGRISEGRSAAFAGNEEIAGVPM